MAYTSLPQGCSNNLSVGILRTLSEVVGREIVVSLLTVLGNKETHIGIRWVTEP